MFQDNARKERNQMGIVYKKMSENELSRIIKMRIDQLTEEYTSVGRTVPQDVNLEASLMDFYKRNLAACNRSRIELDKPATTDTITITITGAKSGAKYDDTCASEVWVY